MYYPAVLLVAVALIQLYFFRVFVCLHKHTPLFTKTLMHYSVVLFRVTNVRYFLDLKKKPKTIRH
jgi:hypothetical protein